MSDLISIREAAHRLGVSADTLRQWERDKRLTAERTEGGHRRYRVEDIERLLAKRSKTTSVAPAASEAAAEARPSAPRPTAVRFPAGLHFESFWQEQLQDARARVEIKRLRREALEQQAEIDKRRALAQQEEAAHRRCEQHQEQLQELKGFGRAQVPAWAEAEARAEIIRDIEHYVTAERFPLELPTVDARVVVQARVGAARAP